MPPDQWGTLHCPMRGPRFPFGNKTKGVFRDHYKGQLDSYQIMFNTYFKGTTEERSRAEKSLKEKLPHVAASEAWREALKSSVDGLGLAPLTVAVIVCAVMPLLVADHPRWNNAITVLASLIGTMILVGLAAIIEPVVSPGDSSGNAWFLVLIALSVGSCAVLYAQQPTGWVIWATSFAALGAFCALAFAATLASNLSSALLTRITIAGYFNAELSYCILGILNAVSNEAPDMVYVASKSYFVANLIEQHWQRLLTAQTTDPAVLQQVRATVRGFAAGMREVGLSVTFPTKSPDSEESFESKLLSLMARQLTAFTTFRYGDLITAEVAELHVRPWFQKVLRGLRSVIAAITPVIMLLVLPKAFNFTISANLYGTLLTVSLAWLALYVVGWLDPKALANVSSLSTVTSIFGPNKQK